MVQTKHMNEEFFSKTLKEFNVAGELVRARQDEKQGLLDEFDKECKRFFFGKISRRALQSSVNKTNKELARLDKEIRQNMARARRASERASKLVSNQAPIGYRTTMSGIVGGAKKKKGKRKKKVVRRKKKVVRRKRKAARRRKK
jgi:hypothetical protein